jgi:hypothetical protein
MLRAGSSLIVLAAMAATGCGSGPKLVPVRGKVTIEGRDSAGVGITFVRIGSEPQVRASAALKPDGSFSLSTYPYGNGAEPGKYKVVLEMDPPIAKYDRYGYVQGTPIEIEVPENGVADLVIAVPWKK